MRNAGLEEAQARIKIARRNINNLRYALFWCERINYEKIKELIMFDCGSSINAYYLRQHFLPLYNHKGFDLGHT